MQSPPFPRYLVPPRSKCSYSVHWCQIVLAQCLHQEMVLKHFPSEFCHCWLCAPDIFPSTLFLDAFCNKHTFSYTVHTYFSVRTFSRTLPSHYSETKPLTCSWLTLSEIILYISARLYFYTKTNHQTDLPVLQGSSVGPMLPHDNNVSWRCCS